MIRKTKTEVNKQIGDGGHCTAQHCSETPTSGKEKDGCCGDHLVKFGLLEKQTAEQVSLHPLFPTTLVCSFIVPLVNNHPLSQTEGIIRQEWPHKHPPPDFQALYQNFLI